MFSLMDDLESEEERKKLDLTKDELLSGTIISYSIVYLITQVEHIGSYYIYCTTLHLDTDLIPDLKPP